MDVCAHFHVVSFGGGNQMKRSAAARTAYRGKRLTAFAVHFSVVFHLHAFHITVPRTAVS